MENKKNIDVVIIGAGLTGLTLGYYLAKAGKKIMLIEKAERAGGVINTVSKEGFTFETGPNTGIIGTPELVELFDDLEGEVQPEIADPKAKNRWILKKGEWHALPGGLWQGITTSLFSMKDKLRVLGEPFRKPGNNPDETLEELVIRRLGKSYLDYAVDPFISGIYAGDPARLVTRFALPKLYNLEQNYGSFIKGAIQKGKEPKSPLEKRVTRDVFSVKGGLNNLTKTLAGNIGSKNILLGVPSIEIEPITGGFRVKMPSPGRELVTEKIVTTIDAKSLPAILPFIPANDLDNLARVRYARVIQVVAGYKKWDGIPLNAFGGLIPSRENFSSLGILFPSSIFKNRAPVGGALLSAFAGGIKKPGIFEKSDTEIARTVLGEIQATLKTSKQPDLLEIFRYNKAIPQYEKSSNQRYMAIEKVQSDFPGLIIGGNLRDGIGMADRVKQAKHIANKLK
jgi:oxygen-dependent protoporphyrinogen oxidase